MKYLILGATGLIGHTLYRTLSREGEQVWGTTRQSHTELESLQLFSEGHGIFGFDATQLAELDGVIKSIQPKVILNCIGITKRRPEINDRNQAIRVNALFPHELSEICADKGIRLIHFSTDCVFDGSNGPYSEESPTTPIDDYGRTKALGEIRHSHGLTIRSSFLGREIFEKSEMLEWFLGTREAGGFSNVWYSGVSAIYLSKVVRLIATSRPDLSGLYQLAAPSPIDKYRLLQIAKESFSWNGVLNEDTSVSSCPTLDGSRLADELQLEIPGWEEMMDEIAQEEFPTGKYRYEPE